MLMFFFCLTAMTGWAEGDEYIINEDFSELTYGGAVQTDYKDWTLTRGCIVGFNVENSNKALKIESYRVNNKDNKGYVLSPYFGYTGDAILTFSYARGKDSGTATFEIKLTAGVVFDNKTSIYNVIVNDGNPREAFKTISLNIYNVAEDTRFRMMQGDLESTFVIDDVKVTKVPVISISESSLENTSIIAANDTKTVTVNTARTLTGGIWNTMCLPFDVTINDMELALGTGQDIQMRIYSNYANNVMNFEEATSIPAGTPFIIKLNNTVVNPTFHAVTISNTPAKTVTDNGVSFIGTYSPKSLLTDGTNLFITTRNTLAIPGEGTNEIKGMRAYIAVPSDFDTANARLSFGDETAIEEITTHTPTVRQTYNLNGQRVPFPHHGLYIVDGRLTFVK